MNRKVVQVDSYDEVELWAGGLLQMTLKYEGGKLVNLLCGPMSLAKPDRIYEPGIISALREEGLLDE
jgi:hypothetical protein